jgi:hypothetical protein
MAVDVSIAAGEFQRGQPVTLFQAPLTWENRRNRYVVSPDGKRFLVVTADSQGAGSLHVVLNWRAGLPQ